MGWLSGYGCSFKWIIFLRTFHFGSVEVAHKDFVDISQTEFVKDFFRKNHKKS